ncbi:thiamine phosphate synthase [Helicobacter aurati]|uniref:Thiamine-phosphate synthase n=1 Tax=Helicobacter aurati TaxID=137778 RepID=A0A3D8J498_9HELI|nr:thiamine phosphate synthase [Helicobacter aurati]RDU72309.1 thiamine phosphate synthase [Helicobacter aurati]
MRDKLFGLYGISDYNLTPYTKIFDYLESAIDGGLQIFQFRDKIHNDKEIEGLIKDLQLFCREKNILFILNDRYKLAIKMQLDGVHLGREELQCFSTIRKNFQGIIGVSCYASLESALYYQSLGADYVAFGSFFQSPTKPNATLAPAALLKSAKQKCDIPICVIGGIAPDNVHLLREADMIAVISGLWQKRTSSLQAQDSHDFVRHNAEKLISLWRS